MLALESALGVYEDNNAAASVARIVDSVETEWRVVHATQ